MTWEQKLQAVQALSPDAHLHMNSPGLWRVVAHVERVEGGMLVSGGGSGSTPEEAVGAFWNWIADPKFVIRVSGGKRYKWNGFMWEEQGS